MGMFWKASAGILITVVFVLAVGKQQKDLALLLAMSASIMVCIAAFSFIEPVMDFLSKLETMGDLQSGVLGILLKITGIGLVTEVAQMICKDSGNTSLGWGMQLLGTAVILSLSIPVFEMLLEMVQQILGEL